MLPGAAMCDTAGELINDLDLVLNENVLLVAVIEMARGERLRSQLLAPASRLPNSRKVARVRSELRTSRFGYCDIAPVRRYRVVPINCHPVGKPQSRRVDI